MSKPFYIKQTLGGKIFDVCNVIFMIILTILFVYPFLNILALSFNNGQDAVRGGIYIWPRMFSTANFEFVLKNDDLIRGTVVSIARTIVGTGTGVVCSALLGYIVTCKGFMGRKFMRILFLVTMYFSGGLIPTYLLMVKLGFVNSFAVYWIPSLFSAYYMLLTSSYIQNLPETLFESARMDGAKELRIFWQFVIPLSVPMLACVAIYIGVNHWNSWFDVNLYSKDGKWDNLQIILYRLLNQMNAIAKLTEQQQISERMKTVQPLTIRAAITVVVTMPIILIYPFFQKYFVSGITIGAVKG